MGESRETAVIMGCRRIRGGGCMKGGGCVCMKGGGHMKGKVFMN